MAIDGAKLEYFSTTTSADAKRVAYLNGSAIVWWLRSTVVGLSIYAYSILANGGYNSYKISTQQGIRPAFILPSDFLLTDGMLV